MAASEATQESGEPLWLLSRYSAVKGSPLGDMDATRESSETPLWLLRPSRSQNTVMASGVIQESGGPLKWLLEPFRCQCQGL